MGYFSNDSKFEYEIQTSYKINDKLIDVDKTTFKEDDETIFIQLANNRDESLNKKKLNGEREAIKLADDEYIGEFIGILLYKNINCLMIQYNKFSVNVNDLKIFLTCVWQEAFYKNMGITEEKDIVYLPVSIDINPVLDHEKLNELKKMYNIREHKNQLFR